MADHSLNIVIGGEAGQGLVTIGQLLAKALVRNGYFIWGDPGLPIPDSRRS